MTNLLIGTFVRECQIFAGHVISVRAAATHRALVHEFVSRLPVPDQPVENLILDGLLFKVALQWSSHVHKQYHADDTTSCGFNPDTDLVRSWRSRHSSPVSVFADWATSFLDKVEQAHRPAPTSRVKEIIDRGIETRLSVRSLARETACHPVRLRAIFKRDVGMSIREYQTRRRILKAAQLLAGTDVKVDAIARAAGFPNRKNFYDAFKRTLHTSHRRSGAGRRPTWNLSRTVYSHKPAVTDGSMTGYVVLWSAQRGPSDPEAPVRMGRELFIRVWTVNDGLGPFMNARSCAGCHAVPRTGGSGTEERSFVSIVPVPQGALTRRVFQRLRVSNTGAIDAHAPPPFAVLRKAPSLFGSGLLEGITDDEIAAGVDELGTRGRVPQGRYGWKGQLRNIEDATAAAFANELGLTSPLFRESSESPPEISQQQIMAVAAFIRALQPLGRNAVSHDPDGQRWFTRMGCATCHRPSFRSLERWKAFPYTDLLLHDMGPALADGVEEGTATGNEFKTPPLWGVASTGPPYLHDGRAKTLHDAISAHGGEAEASADAYRRLNVVERASVLAFLRSL